MKVSRVKSQISQRLQPRPKGKLPCEPITEEKLLGPLKKFEEDTKSGMHVKEDCPGTAQRVTNLSITNKNLCEGTQGAEEKERACCPGWVRTDFLQCLEERAETQVFGFFVS